VEVRDGLSRTLEQPDATFYPHGRVYFAGDHCSHLTTWQEGAALSAQRAVEMIVKRVKETV